MRILPGRNLVRSGAAAAALALLCFLDGRFGWIAPLPLAAAAILAVADYRRIRRGLGQLKVRRDVPATAARGVAFTVKVSLVNGDAEAIWGEIRDVVPPAAQPAHWARPFGVPAGVESDLSYQLLINQRGLHPFGQVWARLVGRFGMLEGQLGLDCPGRIKIMPPAAVSPEALRPDALDERRLLDKLARARIHGPGAEFESLREFGLGDDPARIDWRASARRRRLIVRRFQLEQHRDSVVLLDCGRLMGTDAGRGSKLDCAVDAALILCRAALENGDRCGVGVFGDRVLGYLPPITGPNALRILTESVYNVQAQWKESNFAAMFATLQLRLRKRALVVALSDLTDADTTELFRGALARLAKRHVVLFVSLATPLLGELTRARIDSPRDAARLAVAFRLLRERERALHLLTRAGIHVIDVEPDQVTVPLLNKYIELRGSGTL